MTFNVVTGGRKDIRGTPGESARSVLSGDWFGKRSSAVLCVKIEGKGTKRNNPPIG